MKSLCCKLARVLAPSLFLLMAGTGIQTAWSSNLPAGDSDPLVVHEWGTFLSLQGSDGKAAGGMVDSEEELPYFVRERNIDGSNRACVNCKMETPVTYFYTSQPRTVQVRVGMTRGTLTHWFPAVRTYGPPLQKDKATLADSFLDWGQVQLIPMDAKPGKDSASSKLTLRTIEPTSTWRFARETDSALVKVGPDRTHVRIEGEWEKFLFYRGLGSFTLPLQVRSTGPDDHLTLGLHNQGTETLAGIFVLRVEKDSLRFAALSSLAGTADQQVDFANVTAAKPLQEGVLAAKAAVADALVKAGLYPREAQAMVNTWEKSYFRTEGLRFLYLLPRTMVDATIPLEVKPAPEKLVRVMVGRVEVLTPDREQQIEKALADLHAADPKIQEAGRSDLARLGRFQEPVLRRILARSNQAEVRGQATILLKP